MGIDRSEASVGLSTIAKDCTAAVIQRTDGHRLESSLPQHVHMVEDYCSDEDTMPMGRQTLDII